MKIMNNGISQPTITVIMQEIRRQGFDEWLYYLPIQSADWLEIQGSEECNLAEQQS